jgi:H+/gluconate symporter-like permease
MALRDNAAAASRPLVSPLAFARTGLVRYDPAAAVPGGGTRRAVIARNNPPMLPLLGIFLSLALLMYLAYRGFSVILLAPLLALLAVAFAGGPLLGTYTQVFMREAGKYVANFFPLFLLGAVFGKLMADSGSADAIARWIVRRTGARRAILAVVLACAVLTYGGVSLFVVAFAVFPIAAGLFREAEVPKRLIPGAIALGSFTFTMTALPGTPAIQNLIPMRFFGTDAFAAPGLGLIAGAMMFGGGITWLTWRHRRAAAAGEGYAGSIGAAPVTSEVAPPSDGPAPASNAPAPLPVQTPGAEPVPLGYAGQVTRAVPRAPGVMVAILPILVVIGLNLVVSHRVIPRLDTGYLATPAYGSTTVASVKGNWAIIAALVVACAAAVALNWRRIADVRRSVNEGATGSLLPIFNTASEVGYGAVIASLAAFAVLRDAVLGIAPGNPLVSLAVAVNVLAGITGSASGGMSIALETLGATFAAQGAAAGISPEALHRVTSIASGGLDTLPHNGAVISLLTICGLTHLQSYADIFVVSVVIPLVTVVAVITLASIYGSF